MKNAKEMKSDKGRTSAVPKIATILKYVFSVLLMFLGRFSAGTNKMLLCGFLELLAIWALTESIRSARFRTIVNGILLLLLNAQSLVLWFGGDYISLVMLTNIDNVRDLSGKIVVYILGIAAVLVFSFFPAARLLETGNRTLRRICQRFLPLVLFAELLFTLIYGNIHSPLFAYWRLGAEAKEAARVRKELESIENCTAGFYRKGISCASVERPDTLGDNPNIVLILMEGTSEHIVKDERGIMPNAAELEKKSISFSNYYNHTFATYRGISGQLYSGFQLDNYDSNSLIGIQDILSDKGYYTSFINTEPNLVPFATYLTEMGFDEVIGEPGQGYSGPSGSMTDKEAYDLLLSHIEEKSAGSQPFFTAIYTFGTHASFDSPDEKFGDGSLAELNKFYNADHWLGKFLEKLEASPAFDNTLVVFTADHSTYADLYYNEAFPDYQRQNPTIDSIPLMFYHKGVVPQEIDAAGRNTLDLTSTILDYVDIDAPNYFLGASLFHDPDNYNNLDTIFTSSVDLYSTKGGKIRKLEETEAETAIVREMVQNYYAAKLQIPMTP